MTRVGLCNLFLLLIKKPKERKRTNITKTSFNDWHQWTLSFLQQVFIIRDTFVWISFTMTFSFSIVWKLIMYFLHLSYRLCTTVVVILVGMSYFVAQPHNHIGWATSMSFASINSIIPRTNLWNFGDNCSAFGGRWKTQLLVFLSLSF